MVSLLKSHSRAGVVSPATYDELGRRTSLANSATANTWTTEYDEQLGLPVELNNGRGQIATSEFDSLGRQTRYTSFTGRTFDWEYEGTQLLPHANTAYSGLRTEIEYDPDGNATRLTQGEGQQARSIALTRNAQGRISTLTTAEGDTFTYEYDDLGNISKESVPDGASLNYIRNEDGLPTSIVLPSGASQVYAYDSLGRMTSSTSPIGSALQTNYEYSAGRLSKVYTTGGPEIQYRYTSGRLTNVSTPTEETTYSYNGAGQMNNLNDTSGITIDYTFDQGGRTTSEKWSGSIDGIVSRTYDSLERVSSLAVNDQTPIILTYDADNGITSHGPLTLSRNPDTGFTNGTALANCADERTYTAFGELSTLIGRFEGNEIYSIEVDRDKLGRITSKTESILGTTRQSRYEYDLGGRLARTVTDGVTVTYGYDINGNRLSRTVSGAGAESGTYNAANQIIKYDGESYNYDSAGRLQTREDDSFIYDALGRLRSARLNGASLITYQHDPLGRLIEEMVDGEIQRRFVYQSPLQPIAELDGDSNIRSIFGYASSPLAPDYMLRDGATYRIFKDHQGSPRVVINCDSGEVAQILRHDEFGRVLEDTAPAFQPFGFAGGLFDSNTQLLRFGARDYDPSTAQWTAVDPIGYRSGSTNLYSYVSGDPVNRIDPDGLREYDGASVTLGGTAGLDLLFWGGSVSGGIIFDGNGNIGFAYGYSAGNGVGAEGDASFLVSVTKGDIYKARGPGFATGGGLGGGLAAEGYLLTDSKGNTTGFQGSVGLGGGATIHHHETNTGVVVLTDLIPETYNDVRNWVGDQL